MEIPQFENNITVREPQDSESEALARIGARAFNRNALDWYPDKHTLAAFDTHDNPVAVLVSTPQEMWWGDDKVPGAALSGVATDPEEQQKGYAGGLLVKSINRLREEGVAVCPLWSTSFGYFRKFGWELAARDIRLPAWPGLLHQLPTVDGTVRLAKQEDLSSLKAIYRASARMTNAQSVRNSEWWQYEWDSDAMSRTLVLEEKDGTLSGYLRYTTRPRHQADGVDVEVEELQAPSYFTQATLAYPLSDFVPGVDQCHFTLPQNSLLPDLFPEPVPIECQARLQLRVIDVAKAVSSLTVDANLKGRLAFDITDWVISRDKLLHYCFDIESGAMEVRNEHDPNAFVCSINTFTRLFSGALSTSQAKELGLLARGTREMAKLCDQLFHKRVPYRSAIELG